MGYYIASVSWGKDSLAMLLHLLAIGAPLDEVIFYDTGMEFQAIYDTRDMVLPRLRAAGIKYTELHPAEPFLRSMLERPVESKQKGKHMGYGWCGGTCRWGTTEKTKAMDAYAEKLGATVYVGIAADELPRLVKEKKEYKIHPLAEWGMTERDCKRYCYAMGFRWEENGVELYKVLQRVSCWCCCNKNLRELKNIYKYLPDYWERLKNLQSQLERPMKGFYTDGRPKGIFELEKRFEREITEERRQKQHEPVFYGPGRRDPGPRGAGRQRKRNKADQRPLGE